MATQYQLFCNTRLPIMEAVCHGHAMPICLTALLHKSRITVCASPVIFGTDGCSVPISVGSPPTP